MSKTYSCWVHIKQRCFNKKNNNYKNYGGRGITICSRWKNSFENFLKDMGESPDGLSIDRIDNNGDYEPKNCKWSTNKEQQKNRRCAVLIDGINLSEYCEKKGIDRNLFYGRRHLGWQIKEIISGCHRPKIGERSYNEINYKELKKYVMEQFKRNSNIVKAYLGTLDVREKKIIEMRLGIIDGKRKTLDEIGQEFGVTRERIRQIEKKALEKMSILESEIKADIKGE